MDTASDPVPAVVAPVPASVAPSADEGPKTAPAESIVWAERLSLLLGQTLSGKILIKHDTNLFSVRITACSGLKVQALSDEPLSRALTAGEEVILVVKALSQDKLTVQYFDKKGASLSGGSSISPICPLPIIKRRDVFKISHIEEEFIYLQPVRFGTELENLLNSMFEYYEAQPNDVCDFKVGDICAAQSLDGNWYRAKIDAINYLYTVYYVDYGNFEEVATDKIRILAASFMIHELCVRVCLPVKFTCRQACWDSLNDDAKECAFISKETDRDCWMVDLSEIGASSTFALQWIEENKAEGIPTQLADPMLREPDWDLRKGDLIPIIITHVEKIDKFWVQLGKNLAKIESLRNALELLPEDDGTELGDIFVSQYAEDQLWYRAVEFGVGVRFIDYGNTEPGLRKKKLPPSLRHPIKGYAVPVRLRVRPAGSKWTAEANQAFDKFLYREDCSEDFLEAKIISVDGEIVIDVIYGSESLSSFLITEGHGVPESDAREIRTLPIEANRKPKNRMKRSLPILPPEFKQVAIVGAGVPRLPTPCLVSAATSIHDFYIQLDTKFVAVGMMEEHLRGADTFEVVEDPSVGDYLIAKCPKDSFWYRAQVTSKDPLNVRFVDYGRVSPSAEFRRLPLDLINPPAMAYHCTVENADGVNETFLKLVRREIMFSARFTRRRNQQGQYVVELELFLGPSIQSYDPPPDVDALSDIFSDIMQPFTPSSSDSSADEAVEKDTKNGFPVYITYVSSPSEFYYRVIDDAVDDASLIAEKLIVAEKFKLLQKCEIEHAQIVCAKCPTEGSWKRAKVVSLDPVEVFFIDFGNFSGVLEFRELPEDLLTRIIPPLAVKASLQPQEEEWTAEEMDRFLCIAYSDAPICSVIEERTDLTVVQLSIDKVDVITILRRKID